MEENHRTGLTGGVEPVMGILSYTAKCGIIAA